MFTFQKTITRYYRYSIVWHYLFYPNMTNCVRNTFSKAEYLIKIKLSEIEYIWLLWGILNRWDKLASVNATGYNQWWLSPEGFRRSLSLRVAWTLGPVCTPLGSLSDSSGTGSPLLSYPLQTILQFKIHYTAVNTLLYNLIYSTRYSLTYDPVNILHLVLMVFEGIF